MKDFWVAHWLHCPPEEGFVHGRRVICKHLCFGPAEAKVWFVTPEGGCFYEEQSLEGIQAGERFQTPVSRKDLLQLLDREIALCRKLHQTEALTLFQKEKECWD